MGYDDMTWRAEEEEEEEKPYNTRTACNLPISYKNKQQHHLSLTLAARHSMISMTFACRPDEQAQKSRRECKTLKKTCALHLPCDRCTRWP